jgi:hypothetical protein
MRLAKRFSRFYIRIRILGPLIEIGALSMFSGSIPAIPTPFKRDGIDEAALRDHVSWLIEEGASGILGRKLINRTVEAPEWRTSRAKVAAGRAGCPSKVNLVRDGSHSGVLRI